MGEAVFQNWGLFSKTAFSFENRTRAIFDQSHAVLKNGFFSFETQPAVLKNGFFSFETRPAVLKNGFLSFDAGPGFLKNGFFTTKRNRQF